MHGVLKIAFPALGTLLLALGLYLVVVKGSQSPFAFGALGSSVVLFTIASVSMGYRLFGLAKSVPQPVPPETPHLEAKAAALPELKARPADLTPR